MLKWNFKIKTNESKIVNHFEIIGPFVTWCTEYDTFGIFFINEQSATKMSQSKILKHRSIKLQKQYLK